MDLQHLPEELLQDILSRLSKPDLSSLNLTSKWFYKVATPLLWRHLELVDTRTQHPDLDIADEHDDTPIIKKLLVLVRKPWIAREVITLEHRCHLSPPGIFNELPRMPFCSNTLSCDARTTELLKMAIREMRKVQTVRIVLGHPNLVDVILRSVFNRRRERDVEVRKLWLENCRVSVGLQLHRPNDPHAMSADLNFEGLESVRLRRLPMRPGTLFDSQITGHQMVYSRGGRMEQFCDGLGGHYSTTCHDVDMEFRAGENFVMWLETQKRMHNSPFGCAGWVSSPLDVHPLVELFEMPHTFDDRIFEALEEITELPQEIANLGTLSRRSRAEIAYRGNWLDPDKMNIQVQSTWLDMQREKIPSADAAINMFRSAGATLTSLNLDWILNVPQLLGSSRDPNFGLRWRNFYQDLFDCRFPHLRAFQLRNCVVPDTVLPQGIYLLGYSAISTRDPMFAQNGDEPRCCSFDLAGLSFMEAHPNLQCLAFPMENFFAHAGVSADIAPRVEAVIDNLSRTLVDLRVDTVFKHSGESQTEEDECWDWTARGRRRFFITNFVAKMRKVESIKIEGGMPRDERREIVRALYACPVQKIVMIGISSPLGNTWGTNGEDVGDLIEDHERQELEGEDKSAVYDLGLRTPEPPSADYLYQPQYGWKGMPPMLHTLASFHANTVRELKFCGYKGSAVILSPTAITTPLFSSLKYFHNLESIILSMWLVTTFEGSDHDAEVINFWTQSRTPTSTALVRITDEEPEGWEKELRTKYAPDALAWRITSFLGPFLSEKAKARKGGVHVRASFCVGDFGGIFDCDLRIGKGAVGSDVCLGFVGPREEFEDERRRGKIEARRWF